MRRERVQGDEQNTVGFSSLISYRCQPKLQPPRSFPTTRKISRRLLCNQIWIDRHVGYISCLSGHIIPAAAPPPDRPLGLEAWGTPAVNHSRTLNPHAGPSLEGEGEAVVLMIIYLLFNCAKVIGIKPNLYCSLTGGLGSSHPSPIRTYWIGICKEIRLAAHSNFYF